MKLLFDENLSVHLVSVLADVYPVPAHVHHCGLGSSGDSCIWQYAKDNSFTIVSKAEIESLLRSALSIIERFIQENEESCLVLGVRSKTE